MIESYGVELLYEQNQVSSGQVHRALELAFAAEGELDRPAGTLARLTEVLEHATPPLPEWHVTEPGTIDATRLEDSLQQSWWWPEAREAVGRARHAIAIFDEHNRTTDFRRRLAYCQRIVVALIRETSPIAVHWPPSQQLLQPQQLAAALEEDGYGGPLPGGLNVRFFRLEYDESTGGDEEFLMDTMGLSHLGLADLQCHFKGLDPEDVSRCLYESACYQFDQGRVMADGDTVQGPGAEDRWACTQMTALAEPARGLVDLDPGFPFAAGKDER